MCVAYSSYSCYNQAMIYVVISDSVHFATTIPLSFHALHGRRDILRVPVLGLTMSYQSAYTIMIIHRLLSIANEQNFAISTKSYMVLQIASQLLSMQVKSPAYNTRQVTDFTLENIRANTSQFLYTLSFRLTPSLYVILNLQILKLPCHFTHLNSCCNLTYH